MKRKVTKSKKKCEWKWVKKKEMRMKKDISKEKYKIRKSLKEKVWMTVKKKKILQKKNHVQIWDKRIKMKE